MGVELTYRERREGGRWTGKQGRERVRVFEIVIFIGMGNR